MAARRHAGAARACAGRSARDLPPRNVAHGPKAAAPQATEHACGHGRGHEERGHALLLMLAERSFFLRFLLLRAVVNIGTSTVIVDAVVFFDKEGCFSAAERKRS